MPLITQSEERNSLLLKDLTKNFNTPHFPRTSHLLRHIVLIQSQKAYGRIHPKPFWRFNRQESGFNETLRETIQVDRKYEQTYFFANIDAGPQEKPLELYGEDERNEHTVKIDLAECIRLGEIFNKKVPNLDFHFYLPDSGDVYQWNQSLYEIHTVTEHQQGYHESLERYILWEITASLYRSESIDPENTPLAVIPREEIPRVQNPLWVHGDE